MKKKKKRGKTLPNLHHALKPKKIPPSPSQSRGIVVPLQQILFINKSFERMLSARIAQEPSEPRKTCLRTWCLITPNLFYYRIVYF